MTKEEIMREVERQLDEYIETKKEKGTIEPIEDYKDSIPYSVYRSLMISMRYWDDPYAHEFVAIKAGRYVHEEMKEGFKLGASSVAIVMFIAIVLVWKLFLR